MHQHYENQVNIVWMALMKQYQNKYKQGSKTSRKKNTKPNSTPKQPKITYTIKKIKCMNYYKFDLLKIPLSMTSGSSHHRVRRPSAGVTSSIAEGRVCSFPGGEL